jgi:hypothetical protein
MTPRIDLNHSLPGEARKVCPLLLRTTSISHLSNPHQSVQTWLFFLKQPREFQGWQVHQHEA